MQGKPETLDYSVLKYFGETRISPWHDIPLYAGDGLLNFVCEIPKETTAKMELITDEVRNPIKQDTKDGKLRYYPYNINWNYGMLPQTWEDPDFIDPVLELGGDNDPTDVVDISSEPCEIGGVYKVKPLGAYAMLDDGEVDWKIIVINADDPKAADLNDVDDIETEFPGELTKILEWFRDYKIPGGDPANEFGYNNTALDREFTMKVVNETHELYNSLRSGARPNTEELSLI